MIFESVPDDYSSVNSNLVYVVYDANATDPATYPNYKYVGELWIDGVKVHTSRLFPLPDSGRGEFDFGAIIREYVIVSLAPTSAGIHAQELVPGEFATKDVVVKIREEYGGAVGAVVATDTARVFYNHYNGRYNDFTLLGGYLYKPLSTRPKRTITLTLDCDRYYIPYFAEVTAPFTVTVTPDTPVGTVAVIITPSVTHTMQLINIAPGAINTHTPGAIDATTGSYTVEFGGETYTVNIICRGLYRNYLVHFLNKFGGFETMLFNKVSRRNLDLERKTWKQKAWRTSSAGVVSLKTGNIMHSQQTTFAAKFKEGLSISTDWLTDAEYVWLAELVSSPFIYLEDEGTMYPVRLVESNYEYKEHIVDTLTNLKIGIEFGTSYKTQFQ